MEKFLIIPNTKLNLFESLKVDNNKKLWSTQINTREKETNNFPVLSLTDVETRDKNCLKRKAQVMI